jgi:sulfatase modifying factor 1
MPARRTALVLAGFGFVFSIALIARWPAAAQNESPGRKPNEPKPERPGSFAGTRAGQTRDDNGLKTTLVWIPPGEFTMGSPKDERGYFRDEDQVQVTLTRGFWLGQHEVTQAEWQRVMQTTPWSGNMFVKEGNDYPATYVSWDDGMKFCKKLTEQERAAGRLPSGWKYTLPTEAQWEYACRAGTKSRFSFGDDESDLSDYGWWGGFDRDGNAKGEMYAHTVGQKKANPFRLYDMHGNVSEWCSDYYAKKLAGGTDPQGPSEGSNRVYRGGCWGSTARSCRSANRDDGETPGKRYYALGFRVAVVPPCPSRKLHPGE